MATMRLAAAMPRCHTAMAGATMTAGMARHSRLQLGAGGAAGEAEGVSGGRPAPAVAAWAARRVAGAGGAAGGAAAPAVTWRTAR
jgi:hypothetical protein